MHFPLSSILKPGGQLAGLWSRFGVMKIDFGEIFFESPVKGEARASEYHAVCQINWSELFSKAFDVTGSAAQPATNSNKVVAMIAFDCFMIQVVSCDICGGGKQRLIKRIKRFFVSN
jgi:hypothetical protein